VDKLNESAYFALLNVMREQPHFAPQALNALVISRSLERVADHATNIAEDVIFWVKGADVRHHMLIRDGKADGSGAAAN
jgi:phosphate transport system protein